MFDFIRGDTQPFKFKILKKNKETVTMSEIDTLILTCRKSNVKESPILFQKNKGHFEFDNEYYHCTFKAEDTRELEYGIYNFDIQVTLNNGYVKTLKGQFRITEEDTIYESGE